MSTTGWAVTAFILGNQFLSDRRRHPLDDRVNRLQIRQTGNP
jgi:hypothetical protein